MSGHEESNSWLRGPCSPTWLHHKQRNHIKPWDVQLMSQLPGDLEESQVEESCQALRCSIHGSDPCSTTWRDHEYRNRVKPWDVQLMAQLPVLQPGGIMSRGIMSSHEMSSWCLCSLFSNLEVLQVEESCQAIRCPTDSSDPWSVTCKDSEYRNYVTKQRAQLLAPWPPNGGIIRAET